MFLEKAKPEVAKKFREHPTKSQGEARKFAGKEGCFL